VPFLVLGPPGLPCEAKTSRFSNTCEVPLSICETVSEEQPAQHQTKKAYYPVHDEPGSLAKNDADALQGAFRIAPVARASRARGFYGKTIPYGMDAVRD
jgi:hypothetical protein